MTPAGLRRAQERERASTTRRWFGALFGIPLLVALATPASAGSVPSILLTSGVVKSVDHARGVVVLGSGWTLRVRSVIINDQVRDVSAIQVDDVVFISGAVLASPPRMPGSDQREDR